MRNIGASVHHVYASPALRCVETVNGILKGTNIEYLHNQCLTFGKSCLYLTTATSILPSVELRC